MLPKYRAWDKKEQKMYDVDVIDLKHGNVLVDNLKGFVKFEDVELLQFTGLLDTNNIEIYRDSDIWQYEELRPHDQLIIKRGIISFGFYDNEVGYEDNESGYGYYLRELLEIKGDVSRKVNEIRGIYEDDKVEWLKVIGTVQENPELLEGE